MIRLVGKPRDEQSCGILSPFSLKICNRIMQWSAKALLNLKYKIPSHKHFREKEIPSLYATEKSEISTQLVTMMLYSATINFRQVEQLIPILATQYIS